jgi:hypothetical protein
MWVLLAAVAAVAAAAAEAAFIPIAPAACAHLLISTPSARYNSGKSWLFLICSCDISQLEMKPHFSFHDVIIRTRPRFFFSLAPAREKNPSQSAAKKTIGQFQFKGKRFSGLVRGNLLSLIGGSEARFRNSTPN